MLSFTGQYSQGAGPPEGGVRSSVPELSSRTVKQVCDKQLKGKYTHSFIMAVTLNNHMYSKLSFKEGISKSGFVNSYKHIKLANCNIYMIQVIRCKQSFLIW